MEVEYHTIQVRKTGEDYRTTEAACLGCFGVIKLERLGIYRIIHLPTATQLSPDDYPTEAAALDCIRDLSAIANWKHLDPNISDKQLSAIVTQYAIAPSLDALAIDLIKKAVDPNCGCYVPDGKEAFNKTAARDCQEDA